MWAVEGSAGSGKTEVLAELAELGFRCAPEAPPSSADPDALLAREVRRASALSQLKGVTFVERSVPSIKVACRLYAEVYDEYAESFSAVASTLPAVSMQGHVVIGPPDVFREMLLQELGSKPVIVLDSEGKTAADLASEIVAIANPDKQLFL